MYGAKIDFYSKAAGPKTGDLEKTLNKIDKMSPEEFKELWEKVEPFSDVGPSVAEFLQAKSEIDFEKIERKVDEALKRDFDKPSVNYNNLSDSFKNSIDDISDGLNKK